MCACAAILTTLVLKPVRKKLHWGSASANLEHDWVALSVILEHDSAALVYTSVHSDSAFLEYAINLKCDTSLDPYPSCSAAPLQDEQLNKRGKGREMCRILNLWRIPEMHCLSVH